jgi:putative methyltransferase (TIGR04325 family)
MGTLARIRHLTASTLNAVPPVRVARSAYYERQFKRWPGAFRGVYRSFDEALHSAPRGAKVGYDNEPASLYEDRHSRLFPSDYPVLFWLDRILKEARSVFDFGGHVGIAFYAFEKYLQYPEGLKWLVCDVPRVIEAGRELATKRGKSALGFTTEFAEASGFDVLLASGSLQYLDETLADKLRGLTALPKHLLINKTPLYDGETFATLQNTLHSYNPYVVRNHEDFVASLTRLGYSVVDRWESLDVSCRIPLHPEHSLDHYVGLYLRR